MSGVPMVTAYKVSRIRSRHRAAADHGAVGDPANLVLGENVVPEFIQEDCTPQKLSDALLPLFRDSPERRRQVEAFRRLDAIMEIGKAEPARHAAEIVLAEAARKRVPDALHLS